MKQMPAIIVLLFAVDITVGLTFIANYLIGEPFSIVNRLLDLDGEANLPTWYASMKLFSIALLLGLFAIRNFSPSQWRS